MNDIPYSLNDKDDEDLYGEEFDYYIDTISNLKESLNNSEKNSEVVNNYEYNPMSQNQNKKMKKEKIYKNMDSKDKYIKSLQQKIQQQEEQISKLMDYKNLCEEKIKELNPLISLPLKGDTRMYNDYMSNNIPSKNKNKSNNKKLNLSFNQNHINKKNNNIPFNRANSELNINLSNSDGDKYDKLYSKYIKIINDFKNLSNNSVSTNEYTRLKTQFNELKNKNNHLLKQIQNEKNKTINVNNDNELLIKNLQEQVSTFREELVLSQALVNSLRSELEQYNKKNKKKRNNFNHDSDIDDNDYNDNINNNRNNLLSDNNYRNKNDLALQEENENLKMSLKNNNILLSKVLEENNKLRERNFVNQRPNIYSNQEDEKILNLKDNLKQYENKFDFFNDYINNIKNQIDNLLNELKSILFKFDTPEGRKNVSENFIRKLRDLKTDIERIKNIDRFNLDSTDDEECLKLFLKTIKLLINELEQNKLNDNNDKTNIVFDKTKKYLKEILEIIKDIINEKGTKQLIEDAINIINNLDNLYQIKNSNNLNGSNNINEKIYQQEKELEYIKKLLLNQKKGNANKQLTYIMNYRSPKVENSRHLNEYFFKYE